MENNILIFKNQKPDRYTVADLTCVLDTSLSWKAKGLHLYLISRPPKWQINTQDLINKSIDGKASLYSALNELIDKKYVYRYQQKNKEGKYTPSMYFVHDEPQTDFQDTEIPDTEIPDTEIQPLSINEYSKNNKSKGITKVIPGCESVETQIHRLIDYWNNQNLAHKHTYSEGLVNDIKETLNHYQIEAIYQAIKNYTTMYHDDKYVLPVSYSLSNFIWYAKKTDYKHKTGFIQFLDSNKPLTKYIKYKDKFVSLRDKFKPISNEYNPTNLLDKENSTYMGFSTDELKDSDSVEIEIKEIKERGIRDYFDFSYTEYVLASLFFTRKHSPRYELTVELMKLWKDNINKYNGVDNK